MLYLVLGLVEGPETADARVRPGHDDLGVGDEADS